MSTEIKSTVAAVLTANGITFAATYVGLQPAALGGEYPMDSWVCTLTNAKGATERFDFFTGLGLRAAPTLQQQREAALGFQGLTAKDMQGLTSYGKRYLSKVESLRKPAAPHPAEVLHSIILDSSANDQSFARWCDDYGYDEDSRKAYATYEACQKNADKLARVVPHGAVEALREALQDY